MRHSVLHDERFHPIRIRQRHPKTHWHAVVLHVKRVTRKPQRFGKMIHDFRDVIERVREFFRIRPITMTETGIIRRNQMITIRKARKERLKHPRRRRKSVQ